METDIPNIDDWSDTSDAGDPQEQAAATNSRKPAPVRQQQQYEPAKRPPPIYVCECTIESLVNLLVKANLTRDDFTLKQITTNEISIFYNNIITFAKIKAALSVEKL